MAKLVDALALGACGETLGGSSPLPGTGFKSLACQRMSAGDCGQVSGAQFMKRIETDVPRPDLQDADFWAKLPQTYIAWLRQACPQFGFDSKRIIVVEILKRITGDDQNSFGYFYKPDYSDTAKRHILIRMDTEIATPETPEDVRQQLTAVRHRLFSINWESEAGYEEARTTWISGARDFVQQHIDSRKEYRNLFDDYYADSVFLMPYWRKFIYGGKKSQPRS